MRLESTIRIERAICHERTNDPERAKVAESTKLRERAVSSESTIARERAKPFESANTWERANCSESAMGRERTSMNAQRHVERIATRLCSGVSLRASEAAPHDTGTHSVSLVTPRGVVGGAALGVVAPPAPTSRREAEGEAGRRQGRRQKGAAL